VILSLSLPENFYIFKEESKDKQHFPSLYFVSMKLIKGSEEVLKDDYCPSIGCVLLAAK